MTASAWWTSLSNLEICFFSRHSCFTEFSVSDRVLRDGGPTELDAVVVLDQVLLDGELEIVHGLDRRWRARSIFGATLLTGVGVGNLVGAATGCSLGTCCGGDAEIERVTR